MCMYVVSQKHPSDPNILLFSFLLGHAFCSLKWIRKCRFDLPSSHAFIIQCTMILFVAASRSIRLRPFGIIISPPNPSLDMSKLTSPKIVSKQSFDIFICFPWPYPNSNKRNSRVEAQTWLAISMWLTKERCLDPQCVIFFQIFVKYEIINILYLKWKPKRRS